MSRAPRPTRASASRALAPAASGSLALSVFVRLLKAHSLALRVIRRRLPESLTLPQFDVLAQLHRQGEGMTPGELTRELLVTGGNVTVIVDRLVSVGLAERLAVPHDGRVVLVRLTRQGRMLMQRAIPRHRREVAALLGGVPGADLMRLRDLLGELSRALETQ
jgi:DNA-binding MarR family transcriptional regulator